MQSILHFLQDYITIPLLYWYIAVLASLLLVRQLYVFFSKAKTSSSLSGSSLFTAIPNWGMVNHLTVFCTAMGWTGVVFNTLLNETLFVTSFSIIMGLISSFSLPVLLKQMQSLPQENQLLGIEDAVGNIATVCYDIPGNNEGFGKIAIVIEDSFHEITAFTTQAQDLPIGTQVRVLECVDSEVLAVEKIS